MTFQSFGLNYESAPVAVREAFALNEAAKRELYASLPPSFSSELVLLSTCNRTEVYLFGSPEDAQVVRDLIARRAGRPWPDDLSFSLVDEEAVLHVLRVAAGVVSQVIGDAQILSQIKDAYRMAVEADRVGTVLHRLLHTAFRTSKRVRSETPLCDGAASVSSVAVQLARKHFQSETAVGLEQRSVLLIGLGQMGVAALRALRTLGVGRIYLSNRSIERAEEVAAEVGAEVVDWSARHDAAASVDLVLVASGAPEPILLASALPARDGKALVVDVAMPRNVDPLVAAVPGYSLVDLDALNHWREETVSNRAAALPRAEEICQEGLAEFIGWVLHHEALQPALLALRDTFDAIRQDTLEAHAHRFTDVDRAEVERLTESILQKLLAVPIVRLKATDPESLDFVRGVRFLSHVFSRPGCDDPSARDARQPEASETQPGSATSDQRSPDAAWNAR